MLRPRILLADDHAALLQAVAAFLKPHFDIVGTAADGSTFVSEALRLSPDVIVADIAMPGLNGIDAVHLLRERGSSAKVVFLTVHSEQPFIEACMAEGALGYVLKSHLKIHLIPAIQAALAGVSYIGPFVAR